MVGDGSGGAVINAPSSVPVAVAPRSEAVPLTLTYAPKFCWIYHTCTFRSPPIEMT